MSTFSPSLPGKRHERAPTTPAATPRRVPPALLTIKQVANHLGASPRHVQRLIERKLLRALALTGTSIMPGRRLHPLTPA
jgi:excisionase family DNA binding protein